MKKILREPLSNNGGKKGPCAPIENVFFKTFVYEAILLGILFNQF